MLDKIYIVIDEIPYEGDYICSIWTSREDADAHRDRLSERSSGFATHVVREFRLNAVVEHPYAV